MRRLVFTLLLLSSAAFAQTTVTATVTDPNGNPYANGTASATSVPNSGQVAISTTPIPTSAGGFFSMSLAANTYIFTVCAPPVQIGPLANPTPKQVCFSSPPIAISGSSLDITTTLLPPAPVLGPVAGGGGSGSVNSSTQFAMPFYSNPTGNAISGTPAPTSPNIPYNWCTTPAGGLATQGVWCIPGVMIDAQTGTSFSIPVTDNLHFLTGTNANPTAWSGFPLANNYAFSFMNRGAGLITYTPNSGTVNGGASQIVPQNWFGLHYTDNTNTVMPVMPTIAAFPNCVDSGGNHLNFTAATGALGCGTSGGLPASPQVGDIVRYSVNGDNAWDAVNYAQEEGGIFATSSSATPITVGFPNSGTGVLGSSGDVWPTATTRAGKTYSAAATASVNTVIGVKCGNNGSNSMIPILAFNRFSARMAMGSTSPVRYWMGWGTWNNGSGTGTNSTDFFSTTKYATDTPNSNTIAFRFSSTTDTNWQAVTCVAGGSCTVTNTNVAEDTSVHLFEIATNAAGTSIFYLIDGTLRATITTNIPGTPSNADGLADAIFLGDNKNNNSAIAATLYSIQWSMK